MNGQRRCGTYIQWNDYSAIKENKTMLFATTQMELEIIILSEVSQKDKYHIISYMTYVWNLKYDTNEHIYETETDSQTQRTDLWLPQAR